jgi:hypothetical protein
MDIQNTILNDSFRDLDRNTCGATIARRQPANRSFETYSMSSGREIQADTSLAVGAVTLIQRFGSALNLNIHLHVLFLYGVYAYRDNRPPRFQRVKAPDKGELEDLVQLISKRVGRCLERQGLLEQDTESAWLDLDPAEDTDATPIKRGGPCPRSWAVPPPTGSPSARSRGERPL